MSIERIRTLCATAVLASLAAVATSALASAADVPYSTPAGLTLVDVVKVIGNASTQYLWRRIGDANGKPLYTSDADAAAGKPVCVDECAKEFVPYSAPRGAKAFGDWSVIKRSDGIKQWAYQGQPLYSFTGKDPAGLPSTSGLSTTGAEDPRATDPGSIIFSPKAGWKRAAYRPDKTFETPSDLVLDSLPTANGYGLVDVASHKITYLLDKEPKSSDAWAPVYAPELAMPVGKFAVAARADGTKQWTFQGQRLYTFNGDYSNSDRNGSGVDKARIALVYRHFMPRELDIRVFQGRGPLLVTQAGLSVYTQTRQQLQYGGRETRDGYRVPYPEAKAVGTHGCIDECAKTWIPVLAPKNAEAAGFWEIETRTDGERQWSYKGSPLYTYVGDKAPGTIEGNNRHEIIYGDPNGMRDLSLTGGDNVGGKYVAGSGLYWHLAGLYF